MRFRDIMSRFPIMFDENEKVINVVSEWHENDMPVVVPVLNKYRELSFLIDWKDILYLYDAIKNEISQIKKKSCIRSLQQYLPSNKKGKSWWAMVSADSRLKKTGNKNTLYVVAVDEKNHPVGFANPDKYIGILMESMSEEKDLFENALNWTQNAIMTVDTEGRILFFNRFAEECFGYKKQDVINKHVSEFPIYWDFMTVLKTGKNVGPTKMLLDKIQPPKALIVKINPIIKKQKLIGAVAIFQDITEVELIANELESVKNINIELESFINSSFDGIVISDIKGKIIRVNCKFVSILENVGFKQNLEGLHLSVLEKEGLFPEKVLSSVVEDKKSRTSTLSIGERNEILVLGNPVWIDKNKTKFEKILFNYRDVTALNKLKSEMENLKIQKDQYKHKLESISLLNKQNFIIRSKAMERIIETVVLISNVDSTVLLLGESGVGKDLIARLIHERCSNRTGSFIKINCSAIPEQLLESELFGYEPGSFSGANKQGKMGMFELADGGTLFLDEIGEMSMFSQTKLLQAIQDKEIIRVGGTKYNRVDVRIIAATNQNLQYKIKNGTFRKDLYFRLNVIPILLPPLRERKDEVIELAQYFLEKFNNKYKLNKTFDESIMDRFLKYDWPGNVRELENMIERLVVTTQNHIISSAKFQEIMSTVEADSRVPRIKINEIMPLKEAVYEVEKMIIEEAIKKYGSTHKASKVLGIDQTTVARKLKKLQ